MKNIHIRLREANVSDDDLAMLKAALHTHSAAKVVNYLCTIGIAAYKAATKQALL